jgi:hypothetical protein
MNKWVAAWWSEGLFGYTEFFFSPTHALPCSLALALEFFFLFVVFLGFVRTRYAIYSTFVSWYENCYAQSRKEVLFKWWGVHFYFLRDRKNCTQPTQHRFTLSHLLNEHNFFCEAYECFIYFFSSSEHHFWECSVYTCVQVFFLFPALFIISQFNSWNKKVGAQHKYSHREENLWDRLWLSLSLAFSLSHFQFEFAPMGVNSYFFQC